jgi:hypothetical protein
MPKKRLVGAVPFLLSVLTLHCVAGVVRAQDKTTSEIGGRDAIIIEIEPVTSLTNAARIEISPVGSDRWFRAEVNQTLRPGDQLRTTKGSRAVVRLSNLTPVRVGENSLLQIPSNKRTALELLRGLIYFFHRDRPGLFPIGTPTASAIIRGTEFHLHVAEDGTSTLTLFEGTVELTNQFGQLALRSGEAARTVPGQPPVRTAALEAINLIQWVLYYPAIIDANELKLPNETRGELSESLSAYGQGDVLAAVAKYPSGREPVTDEERVYRGGILLAVGQLTEIERLLNGLDPERSPEDPIVRQAGAIRALIATVKSQQIAIGLPPATAAESLAASYYLQARRDLDGALRAARESIKKSPEFGFAWARVAELEFSFGRTAQAKDAVTTALRLMPRNAEALAVKGFLLAAENRIEAAVRSFDQAVAIDGALGNAWLGRGLCRMRRGDTIGGLQDLQTAALLEPQRALLRSYLAKGLTQAGEAQRGANELGLAMGLDANDPTPWLYSALLKQQQNRVNEAVRDLDHSQELNENRSLYRSRLLLDQDRAVRGVNLARIYDDAGLNDVSVWEAARAVNADYANFSAHLFLADSFQRLRDLRSVNQRFETPAVNEYLLATLLAPVGAGTLAHSVSQQEYSKLFERDGFGFASATEYVSRGRWTESAAQYGTFGNFGYALSAFHQSDPGQHANNDLKQTELSLQLQHQITPQDTAYLRAIYGDAHGGDLAQYYDPAAPHGAGGPNTLSQFKEHQEPLLLFGYRHEWSPGIYTLALAGRLNDELKVTNPQQSTVLVQREPSGDINFASAFTTEQNYRNDLEIYTAELQQIWQTFPHTLIAGARYQTGDFASGNLHTNPSGPPEFLPFLFPTDPQHADTGLERLSAYAYHNWQLFEPLLVTAGIAYDRLTYPVNFRFAPLSSDEHPTDRVSPKAGVIWTPTKRTTARFAYSQSLGGVTFDQSFRLEPVQVAGFSQAFRSLAPESVAGSSAADRFQTWNLSLEQRIGGGTYIGVGGEILQSKGHRLIGGYETPGTFDPYTPTQIPEQINFRERSLLLSASQLLANEWSFGARYRLSQAQLRNEFVQVLPTATLNGFVARNDLEAVLNQLTLFSIYNHPSGLFGEGQAVWYAQHSQGYSQDLPSDEFWQFNLFAGYRFLQRRGEVRVGLLNLTDQDYRLNPLNLVPELPRERTFVASLRFYF